MTATASISNASFVYMGDIVNSQGDQLVEMATELVTMVKDSDQSTCVTIDVKVLT